MNHLLYTLFLLLLLSPVVDGQELSWKKHVKLAEEAVNNRDFEQAGFHFEKAWRQKTKKGNLAYKAAENFYLAHDYKSALPLYKAVKEDKSFPLAALYYSRCLKHDQQYDLARKELLFFNSKYQGADRNVIKGIVANEVAGCTLGATWLQKYEELQKEQLLHLPEEINTLGEEFAPLSLSNGLLYFGSTINGTAEMLRTRQSGKNWDASVRPEFPELPPGHMGGGTFSPDMKTFYFSICENDPSFDPIHTPCDLWAIKLENREWKKPVKLPAYLKLNGTTAMHPFVYQKEDKEVLLFVSDRKGGKGGLDIWRAERSMDSPAFDFTFPLNLGKEINTLGNELTPFYDNELKRIYFSSNGWPGVGGQDVFMAKGRPGQWERPENMGPAINSSMDEIAYQLAKGNAGAYFASNRLNGLTKISTLDFDLWQFLSEDDVLYAVGQLTNIKDGAVRDAQVSLYEVVDMDKERMLERITTQDGSYKFALLPGKKYRIDVSAAEMRAASHTFEVEQNPMEKLFQKDVTLREVHKVTKQSEVHEAAPMTTLEEKSEPTVADKSASPEVSTPEPSVQSVPDAPKPEVEQPAVVETVPVVESTVSKYPNHQQSTEGSPTSVPVTAPKVNYSGVYYRVQVRAVDFYDPNSSMFTPISGYGVLHSEYLEQKGLTRVLVGDYSTLDEAKQMMESIRGSGFPDAFLVKYRNGRRVTP